MYSWKKRKRYNINIFLLVKKTRRKKKDEKEELTNCFFLIWSYCWVIFFLFSYIFVWKKAYLNFKLYKKYVWFIFKWKFSNLFRIKVNFLTKYTNVNNFQSYK